MSTIVQPGCKLLVVHRRLFETDESRFFVGEIDAYEHGIARIRGYSFVRDPLNGTVIRKPEERTKIISFSSNGYLFYVLPDDVELSLIRLRADQHDELYLTDGHSLTMDLSERPHRGTP